MSKLRPELYIGREQSYVKHFVLKHYLEKLAYKVGSAGATLNYVDGFAGPWQSKDDELIDTSPHIALRVLRDAREGIRTSNSVDLRVRAMFVEKDPAKFEELKASVAKILDIDVVVKPGEFEIHIGEAVAFGQTGANPFCFAFIDPCGWTGYGLNAITPLLRVERCEVLINFMTNSVNEFIHDLRPQTAATFEDQYGSGDFRTVLAGLEGLDRQEAMVSEYCKRVLERGRFKHVVSAVILNSLTDRAHYHLVYATRKDEGLRTFRDIERRALKEQEAMRARAQQRKRQARSSGQGEMFGAEALATPYVDELRQRYHARAREAVLQRVALQGAVPFDDLVLAGMQHPMTAEQDVRNFLMEEVGRGVLAVDGLRDKKRKPKWHQGHLIRLVQA